jgi:ribosome biogenesis GTPase
VEEQRTQFSVITERGMIQAQLTGKFLRPDLDRLERPLAGDWVVLKTVGGEAKGIIHQVLPRKTLLKRRAAGETEAIQPLAANVDLAFIVTSANRDFNLKRIDRYLTIIHESGAQAAILLTKAELDPAATATLLHELRGAYPGTTSIALSARTGEGIPDLAALFVRGQTCVFLGSSGVGKSTLVNALLAREEQATKEIRAGDDRGRHTTTSRRLLVLPEGALVIDTPGLREIQLDASQTEGLEARFAKIEEYGARCRFSNCRHESEPGCAVKTAVKDGEISADEYQSFLKLRAQIAEAAKKPKKNTGRKPRPDYND